MNPTQYTTFVTQTIAGSAVPEYKVQNLPRPLW